MATIVSTSPASTITYDKEKNITWDDIAPSLQAKFTALDKAVEEYLNSKVTLMNTTRITIGPEAPIAPYNKPEQDKEVWFDTTENAFKFYMSRNDDGNYAWEVTKAAWYGGSAEDVVSEKINGLTDQWSLVKTMAWVSNKATNNSYDSNTDVRQTDLYTIPKAGTYLIRDMSYLFPYNKQAKYEHDGGRLQLIVAVQKKGASGLTNIINNTYDAQTYYSSYNYTTKTYPEVIQYNMAVGDRIMMQVSTLRNPKSTDDTEVMQSAAAFIYRLNSGNATDSTPPSYINGEGEDLKSLEED